MWKLSVTGKFDAAHCLYGYQGKCSNVHGHTWKVVVNVICNEYDSVGIALDFKILKERLNMILQRLDHRLLVGVGYVEKVGLVDMEQVEVFNPNPTAEILAYYVYDRMVSYLSDFSCKVDSVVIYESPDSWVEYRK